MAAFAGLLNIRIGADTSELEKKLKDVNKRIKALEKKISDFGKGMSALAIPIAAIGGAAFAAGAKFEKAFRIVQAGTTATGAELKALRDDFKTIAALGPQSFEDSARAIDGINTATGATGKVLQDLSMAVLDASRMMGEDLKGNIDGLSKLLVNWNIAAEDGVAVMDKLYAATKATNTSMSTISHGIAAAGGALRGMGVSLEESIALIAMLNKAGLEGSQAAVSLGKAMGVLGKRGITDTSQGLRAIIASIKEASTMTEALTIGRKLFEIDVGTKLAIAIRDGKFEVEDLARQLENAGGAIATASKETMTLGERWSTVGNQFAIALEPLGTKLVKMAESYIPSVSKALEGFSLDLDEGTIKIFALVAAIGPVTLALGGLAASFNAIITSVGALIGVLSGPVGLTVALGLAVAGFASYVDSSNKARIAAEDMAEAQNWLNESFQNASAAQIQGELENLRKELVVVESQAISTRTELGRMLAFGERGSWGMPDQASAEAGKIQAKIKVLEGELANRGGADAQSSKSPDGVDTGKELDGLKEKISALAHEDDKPGGSGGKKAGGGGGKSGPSALDLFVRDVQDRIKYFNEDGNAYMAKIDAMQAKTKPLSDDWKRLQDLRLSIDDTGFTGKLQKIQDEIKYLDKNGTEFIPELQKMLEGLDPLSEKWKRVQDAVTNITESEYGKRWSDLAWEFSEGLLDAADYARMLEVEIAGLTEGTDKWRARFSELQNIKASEIGKVLDSISRQFENGVLSNAEYEAALAGIISEFQEFPRAAKIAAEALDAFQKQNELTTVSLERRLFVELKNVTKEFNELGGDAVMGVVDGFLDAAVRGGDFGESLRKLGEDIVYTTLKMVILQQMSGWLGQAFNGITGGGGLLGGLFGFADGGAFSHGHLTPFARGGVVHRPTIFPMATGAGLMGEAGPEAVMPLERDSHGRLGVVASGAGMGAPSVTVNVINESSQPVTATQTGPSFDEQMRQMVVGVILRDQAQNGPITQNFRRR